MKEEPVRNTVCGVVVDYIMDQVAKKIYNVGDKLPPERDIAVQMNVSRATVREAIKVLNYLGFVDSTQGSGNYITDTYSRTTGNIMKVMFLRGDIDIADLTTFRQMIEIQSFLLALTAASDTQINEMKQIVNLLDATSDSNLILTLDNRFHTILAEASHNQLIIINFHALSSVIGNYQSYTYYQTVSKKKNGFKTLQKYHHEIVDALISKNTEAGTEAILNHFKWVVE